jgi:DNA-binding response OmpR family regulator
LVEDEAPLSHATQAYLEGDFQIDVAGTVAEARQLLGTKQYAVIISDHMLPGKEQGLNFSHRGARKTADRETNPHHRLP